MVLPRFKGCFFQSPYHALDEIDFESFPWGRIHPKVVEEEEKTTQEEGEEEHPEEDALVEGGRRRPWVVLWLSLPVDVRNHHLMKEKPYYYYVLL